MTTQSKAALAIGAAVVAIGLGYAWWPSGHGPSSPAPSRRAVDAPPGHDEAGERGVREGGSRPTPAVAPSDATAAAAGSEVARADGEYEAVTEFEDDRYLDRSVPSLLERLSSEDESLVLDAADGLRARKAVEAIPRLVQHDLVKQADSARSVIDALGALAGHADPAARTQAVERLLQWLEQEKNRPAADALGNVLQIYEALGETQDPRAAAALERELLDREVPLAAKVVIVASLVKLAQPSSPPVLQQARAQVAMEPAEDEFAVEVRKDVLQVIDEALASWGGAAR